MKTIVIIDFVCVQYAKKESFLCSYRDVKDILMTSNQNAEWSVWKKHQLTTYKIKIKSTLVSTVCVCVCMIA